MSQTHLRRTLDHLGQQPRHRYSIYEVSTILGMSETKVRFLLKHQKLTGMKSSERRWAPVFHDDLEIYLESVQPKCPCHQVGIPG